MNYQITLSFNPLLLFGLFVNILMIINMYIIYKETNLKLFLILLKGWLIPLIYIISKFFE